MLGIGADPIASLYMKSMSYFKWEYGMRQSCERDAAIATMPYFLIFEDADIHTTSTVRIRFPKEVVDWEIGVSILASTSMGADSLKLQQYQGAKGPRKFPLLEGPRKYLLWEEHPKFSCAT